MHKLGTAIVQLAKWLTATSIRLSMIGLQQGPRITRYYMYQRLEQFRQSPDSKARVLSISHSEKLCEILGLDKCQIVEGNYPEYNMMSLPCSDSSFDYVVSDQVLEHIEGDPQVAIDETWRVLKPGGIAVHTTCFINPVHEFPGDFWRFTPDALKLLCKRFSRIIESDGWGNPYVWILAWLGLRYDGVPRQEWHPFNKIAMLNDREWPIVTWVTAEK